LARALIQVDADVGRSSLVVGRAQQAQNETTTNERHLTTNEQRPTTNDPPPPLVVFDEFTSVVDRNVARVVSAAIAKGIRTGRIARRFVAVTCHYDVAEWLAPDWIIDMATATFERTPHALCAAESERTPHTPCEVNRRRLRRPPITLEIVRCSRDAWPLFARHHYLSAALNPFAQCYLALWNNVPVAFCATLAAIGAKKVAAASHCKVAAASCRAPEKSGKMPLLRCRRRITRLVTLPGYQGIGIGMALAESVAELNRAAGYRLNITASHPAVIAHCRRSPKWRAVNIKRTGSSRASAYIRNYRGSLGRAVVSFEYAGNPGNANLLIGDV
jgi:GNAT superfamily N-acetyltransferase